MPLTRRRFLATSAAGAALAAADPPAATPLRAWAAGCGQITDPSPEDHLLSRATFGVTAAERARVRTIGPAAWRQRTSPTFSTTTAA